MPDCFKKEYQMLKKSSVALWQTFLEDVAAARVAEGNLSKATVLQQLQTHEYQCATMTKTDPV